MSTPDQTYEQHFNQVRDAIDQQGGHFGWFDETMLNRSITGETCTTPEDGRMVRAIRQRTAYELSHQRPRITIITVEGARTAGTGEAHNTNFGEYLLGQIEQRGLRRDKR